MKEVRAGRSPWWAAGLVLCTGLVALAFFLLTRPETAVLPPPLQEGEGTSRAAAAAQLLDQLVEGLDQADRSQVVDLAAPGDREAERELTTLYSNVRELGIADLDMRYVDERALGGARQRVWTADVQVGWRLGEYDDTESRLEIGMTFRETREGAAFVTARDNQRAATPLWLLDRLAVEQGRRTLVMTTNPKTLDRFAGLAEQAVRDVLKVLPEWRGDLVVAVPRGGSQLSKVLGASEDTYAAIAAVTTSVDGSSNSKAVRVFVNPPVFSPLGDRGAQIVMSHEAAHVATGAASSRMPTWLLEGFADYVALAHVDLPVEVTASQILELVRREGPPAHLPGAEEFQSENPSLGASYEAAWLACRLIADTNGERALIRFYRHVERSGDIDQAFRSVLDTSESDFTELWRRHLRELAT